MGEVLVGMQDMMMITFPMGKLLKKLILTPGLTISLIIICSNSDLLNTVSNKTIHCTGRSAHLPKLPKFYDRS